MKHIIPSVAFVLSTAVAAFAGPSAKTISEPATTVDYGTGAYIALQAGLNLSQNTFTAPADSNISSKSLVGGFGGLKGGYVFGKGLIRPAVEADVFYNGFSQDLYAKGFGKFSSTRVDSAAYLVNGIARINLGRFQPYAGLGIGGYTADAGGSYGGTVLDKTTSDWAWQAIGGLDYYVTPSISVFTEYKFLNYMNSWDRVGHNSFSQHLAGAGVRFHF